MEAKATRGYIIQQFDGKLEINSGEYYNHTLERKMPVVGSVKKEMLEKAVIDCVLENIKEG